MPMIDRRPNLASLVVPAPSPSLSEEIRTPLPHTPLVTSPFAAAPMVMTPDTPSFPIASIEATLTGVKAKRIAWSETQDDLIQSYLSHPPRPLKNTYPPDSLPPPAAIQEIALQILLHPQWPTSHGLAPTRTRVLELARRNVTEYHQGPKREYVPIMPVAPGRAGPAPAVGMGPALAKRTMRPKLTVGATGPGSLSMNRQADSMDSLYGDAEPGTFSEALRLSNTLQDTAASGAAHELSSVGALSSPLDFTFTFNPPEPFALPASAAGQTPFPHIMRPLRPASLLQRGRSFTGHDLASIPCMIDESARSDDMVEDEHEEMKVSEIARATAHSQKFRRASQDGTGTDAEVIREPSSPISSFTVSPPSSITSSVEDEDMPNLPSLPPSLVSSISSGATTTTTTLIQGFGGLEVEPEPLTPLNPTFFSLNTPLNPRAAITPNTSHTGSAGLSTPAITLTVDSPCADTPRLAAECTAPENDGDTKMASPSTTATAQAFAQLSLNTRMRQPPPAPIARRARPATLSTGLSRSLSEGMVSPSHASSIARLAKLDSGLDADAGHCLARPMNKRQKSNTPELSVFVPRPGGRNWAEELRSPFEHKPAGSGGAQGVST